jgi:hypothetical protein
MTVSRQLSVYTFSIFPPKYLDNKRTKLLFAPDSVMMSIVFSHEFLSLLSLFNTAHLLRPPQPQGNYNRGHEVHSTHARLGEIRAQAEAGRRTEPDASRLKKANSFREMQIMNFPE